MTNNEKNYTVVGINGYRRESMTLDQATLHADTLRLQMANAGWAGKVRVLYRDMYINTLAANVRRNWDPQHTNGNPWCETVPAGQVLRAIEMREVAACD